MIDDMHSPAMHLPSLPTLSTSFHSPSSNPYSLFEIRLEKDVIVFWGSEYESTGQLMKGVLVLCLQSPLRLEDIGLSLDGTLRRTWTSDPGIAHKTTILQHKWPPFAGNQDKSIILPAGNYEWPFEYIFPSKTAETVEGIPEASMIYRLKATINRGKLARQLCTRKSVRIIRTIPPISLEFMHTTGIDNTWVDKIDYSIAIESKAVVFGTYFKLEMRITPLAKGLELERMDVTLVELGDFSMHSRHYIYTREHRTERTISRWDFEISREQSWQDIIDDTNQEGWVITKKLELPKSLCQCIQDLEVHDIKIRHKVKVHVPIKNQGGHFSQLNVTLPLVIFISPNMPLDEQGNLVTQCPNSEDPQFDNSVPPEYGHHLLDCPYEDINTCQNHGNRLELNEPTDTGLDTNIPSSNESIIFHPDMLAHQSRTTELSSHSSSDTSSLDENEPIELSKVPTYRTAVRTALRPHAQPDNIQLPDYHTAAGDGA